MGLDRALELLKVPLVQPRLRIASLKGRRPIIENSTNDKSWRGCGEKGTLVHCWRDYALVQPMENSREDPQKVKTRATTPPSSSTSGYLREEIQNTR